LLDSLHLSASFLLHFQADVLRAFFTPPVSPPMITFLLISLVLLWFVVLFLGFLLMGALRTVGLVSWRLEQVQSAMPQGRFARDGLKTGSKAPEFTLPAAGGGEVSLRDFAGREVLLVFVQGGCGPCHQAVPALNKVRGAGAPNVMAIFNGSLEDARQWAAETHATFPVLAQDKSSVSKPYQAFVTPLAFLVDASGVIRSKGIVSSAQHIGYILSQRDAEVKTESVVDDAHGVETTHNSQKEFSHV
jgi:peroxiredoxin Q/BCP